MNAMDKVLIVNDDPKCLSILREGLQKYKSQYEVFTASGGQEAIVVSKQNMASVLVTDLVMPEADGAKPLAHLTKKHPPTAPMVIRGLGSPEIKKRANQEDVVRYFQKPPNFSEPDQAIIRGLDRLDDGTFFVAGALVSNLL
jgi:DNA-binding NtrC family response regulator